MNNTINCTCILTDNQLERLHTITEVIKGDTNNANWDNQMTIQLAIGTTHLTEMILLMLENYIEDNLK